MTNAFAITVMIALFLVPARVAPAAAPQVNSMHPTIAKYVAVREAEFDQVPAERVAELKPLADFVAAKAASGEPLRLTFICTHNSRRSQMAQLWGAVAAHRYGVANVETYSGGTEGTAFNPRAVAALERAGFEIEASGSASTNPRYAARFAGGTAPQTCFSKRYDESPNPSEGFAAVMVCSQADEACPTVRGAEARFAIPYEDPKVADDTPEEAATYDERCEQIAREVLLVFKLAAEGSPRGE
ncbi:MAG: protein-tyrosine-phosphatase [Lacipirellulaceae bacterium]